MSNDQSTPPEVWEPLLRLARFAQRFLRIQAASGILLLVAAAVALVWANSRWSEYYFRLWQTPVGIRLGVFEFQRPLAWLVNDGLMVIFFFVVGLEIRREIHYGELSEWRRVALPIAAAIGGMIVPTGLYLTLAGAAATRSGWGVPIATDIAFAVGMMTLLGPRVPATVRVLLLALAVIDDLGAIAVIGLFYSSGLFLPGLLVAACGFLGILVFHRLGVRAKIAYVALAVVAWAGTYAGGIHPTIAGVIVGLMTPVRAWLGPKGFAVDMLEDVRRLATDRAETSAPHELASTLHHIKVAHREAMSPAESLIARLHPWVAFAIMPVFALANAGVKLSGTTMDAAARSVAAAVAVGLVVGKPLGILGTIWLVICTGLGTLPAGVTWRHLIVLGVVAGIGFTMSLFIAQLAFGDARLLDAAKLGVLGASGAAIIVGLVLSRLLPVNMAADSAQSAAEAADRA